jgi:sarcosine oxidase subunit beta
MPDPAPSERGASTVEVAVVGGGVIGLAVAVELGRAGVHDVVVLERLPAPGQGSTAKANGGVRAQFGTRVNVEFSRFSIGELERLDRDTGGLPRLVQAGYLLVTGTEAGEQRLRAGHDLQRSLGVRTQWLSPREVLAKAPFVRAEGIRAGTFHDRDGFIDPHGVVSALTMAARGFSTSILTSTSVTGIARESDGTFALATTGGPLRARWLVNAAGADAAEVAAFLGVDLPVRPVRRNLACTDPVAGYPRVIPMCVDVDTGVLVRRESGGFLLAWSDPDDPPGRDTAVDPRFLDGLAERVGNRFPFLERVPIDPKKCWAGLYPETPDHHAIVGVTPGVPRFLQCVGFGGHGIMHAPAAGKAIAELVTAGASTTLDIRPLRLARFAEGDLVVEPAVL